jgi:hypothetical protein
LLPYLIAAGFHVRRECKMHIKGKQRVFDFVVRPIGRRDANTDPAVDDAVRYPAQASRGAPDR